MLSNFSFGRKWRGARDEGLDAVELLFRYAGLHQHPQTCRRQAGAPRPVRRHQVGPFCDVEPLHQDKVQGLGYGG
jgi:hypothetical protein